MKIDKSKLDALIVIGRTYWETADVNLLNAQRHILKQVSVDLFGNSGYDNAISDAVHLVISPFGLATDKSNEQVYKLFGAMGIEVI